MSAFYDFVCMMNKLLDCSFNVFNYSFSIKDMFIASVIITIVSRVLWGILE